MRKSKETKDTRECSPLTASLAKLAGTREPDSVVRHLFILFFASERRVQSMNTSAVCDGSYIPCNVEDGQDGLVKTQRGPHWERTV